MAIQHPVAWVPYARQYHAIHRHDAGAPPGVLLRTLCGELHRRREDDDEAWLWAACETCWQAACRLVRPPASTDAGITAAGCTPLQLAPALREAPLMLAAIAKRNITAVYRQLVDVGITQQQIAQATGQSQSEVHEILAGRQVQYVTLLERICDGLGIPRGWMGLAYTEGRTYAGGVTVAVPPEWWVEKMKRRAFVIVAAGAVLPLQPPRYEEERRLLVPNVTQTPQTPLPSRLGEHDAHQIAALTTRMRELAHRQGGVGCADLVSGAADYYTQYLHLPGAEEVRAAVGSRVAELHRLAGWCHYDGHSDDAARYHYTQAIQVGTETGDGRTVTDALLHAGILHRTAGALDEALDLCRLAQVGLTRQHDPTLSAHAHADAARALASMGGAAAARSELAAARGGWDPPTAFDRASMDYSTAQVQRDLGRLDTAEPFAASAVRTWQTTPHRRSGVLAHITFAELHVRAGEPDGLRLAHHAITSVAELTSVRARDQLSPLIVALDARPGSDARELARKARQVAATRA